MRAGDIAQTFEMSRPAVVKHLRILREGALVEVHQQGRERLHRLCPDALKSAADWFSFFDQFWDRAPAHTQNTHRRGERQMKIVKTIFIKAPAEHVWRYLTEGDKLALWFYRGRADMPQSGDFVLETNSYGKDGEKMIWGEVKESEPPRRLVHGFTHQFLEGVETICAWTLTEEGGGTILTLEHSGFERLAEGAFDMASNHDKGWDEHFLRLRHVAR